MSSGVTRLERRRIGRAKKDSMLAGAGRPITRGSLVGTPGEAAWNTSLERLLRQDGLLPDDHKLGCLLLEQGVYLARHFLAEVRRQSRHLGARQLLPPPSPPPPLLPETASHQRVPMPAANTAADPRQRAPRLPVAPSNEPLSSSAFVHANVSCVAHGVFTLLVMFKVRRDSRPSTWWQGAPEA